MPSKKPLVTIPDPTLEPASLRASVLALKELAEVLGGQRGSRDMRAVTWADLVRLGLATDDEKPTRQPAPVIPPNFTSFTYILSAPTAPPPAIGEARVDTPDIDDATQLWLSGFTSGGINNLNFFRVADFSRVLIQEASDPNRWVVFTAPGTQTVNDVEVYVEIPVAWDSSGPSLPRDGETLVVAVG